MSQTTEQPQPEDEALLTTEAVAERYSVHPRSIPQLVKDKKIPPPLDNWTGRTKRWLRSEIVAHMRAMRKREHQEKVA